MHTKTRLRNILKLDHAHIKYKGKDNVKSDTFWIKLIFKDKKSVIL